MEKRPGNNNGKKTITFVKRKLRQSRLFAMGVSILLIIAVIRMWCMHAKLQTMQETISQLQTQQDRFVSVGEIVATDGDSKNGDSKDGGVMEGRDLGEASYVQSIARITPEKPIQRTREEAIQKLRELGENDPVIETICQNSALYPENLLVALANNPEMADFAAGYPSRKESGETISLDGLTDWERQQEFPLFLQWDPRWGYEEYGDNSNIGLAGCGPTCLSMILYYLTGREDLTPDRIGSYAMKNDYYVEGVGTAWALLEDVPSYYGISVNNPRMEESILKAELDRGKFLICAMSKGDFTVAGHFIVLYGYDENGFFVNDPNCVARSRKQWTFTELEKQLKCVWSYERKYSS